MGVCQETLKFLTYVLGESEYSVVLLLYVTSPCSPPGWMGGGLRDTKGTGKAPKHVNLSYRTRAELLRFWKRY